MLVVVGALAEGGERAVIRRLDRHRVAVAAVLEREADDLDRLAIERAGDAVGSSYGPTSALIVRYATCS
jgi:hypothetical protein